jgi:hypothetical protein
MPVMPALTRLEQVDGEFEISLGYIMSSRPAWATQGVPVSNNNNKIRRVDCRNLCPHYSLMGDNRTASSPFPSIL